MWVLFLYVTFAFVGVISALYYIELVRVFRVIRKHHPDLWLKLGKPNFTTQSPEAHRQLHKYLKMVINKEQPELVAGAQERASKVLLYYKINSIIISLVAILLVANALFM